MYLDRWDEIQLVLLGLYVGFAIGWLARGFFFDE